MRMPADPRSPPEVLANWPPVINEVNYRYSINTYCSNSCFYRITITITTGGADASAGTTLGFVLSRHGADDCVGRTVGRTRHRRVSHDALAVDRSGQQLAARHSGGPGDRRAGAARRCPLTGCGHRELDGRDRHVAIRTAVAPDADRADADDRRHAGDRHLGGGTSARGVSIVARQP